MSGRGWADTEAAPAARRRAAHGVAASGRIYFWQSGSLWIGTGRGRSEWHDHHAHQLALALEGEFRFRADQRGDWSQFAAAIVPSHVAHEFELDDVLVAHLFVEPECREGRALARRFGPAGLAALPQDAARQASAMLLAALRDAADPEAMTIVAQAAVAVLADTADVPAIHRDGDPRIARALDYIAARIRAPVSLADAAAAAALSPSRFRHLFVEDTGTSFRAYVLWLRINVAIAAAVAGASWTEAAHEAGFADSSHLTRTHRRMFGIEPTAIRQA